MSLPMPAGGGGPAGWRAAGKEAKFWYIGSKFMQERAKFSNLKWDRELKRRLEQLASDERSRLYDLQQDIYSVRAIYRAQKMERWSSRLNAELAEHDRAAVEAGARAQHAPPLGSWIDDGHVAAIDDGHVAAISPATHERLRRSVSPESHSSLSSSSTPPPPPTPPSRQHEPLPSPLSKQLALDDGPRDATVAAAAMAVGSVRLALHTKGGFVYHPIQRPRSLRETGDSAAASEGSDRTAARAKLAKRQPNSQELLATLLGEKFASEAAIRERIARRHKVNFTADEYTDGAMAYAKRQLSIKKSKLFSDSVKNLANGKDDGEGKSEDASFRLDERKLKQLQVAQQQLSYDQSLSRVENFLGVAPSSTSRRYRHPALTERDTKVISLLQAAAAK